jgi:hypothetical protein
MDVKVQEKAGRGKIVKTKVEVKVEEKIQKTHCVSVTKTEELMLCREIIAVCSEIHTKHINTLCGQNVAFKDSVRTAQ